MNRNRHRPGYLPAKMLQRSECCGDVRLHTKQNNNNNQTVGRRLDVFEYNQRINERRRGLLMLYRRRGEKLYARMFATSVPRSQASASARKTAGTFSAKGIQQQLFYPPTIPGLLTDQRFHGAQVLAYWTVLPPSVQQAYWTP